jgi:hypothetical protein
MVMGYKNDPVMFQRIMNTILDDVIGKGVEVYLDDVLIHARNIREHDRLVRIVFERKQSESKYKESSNWP